jgi:hypothetical protein
VLRVDDPRTEAEVTVKAIRAQGKFEMKKPSRWGKGYQIEKRVMGNDDVGERIYRTGRPCHGPISLSGKRTSRESFTGRKTARGFGFQCEPQGLVGGF